MLSHCDHEATTPQMYVQCVWYYYPEDTHTGRIKKHHKQEVFLSDLSDVNTVDSLLEPVEVVSFHDYSKRVNSSPKKGNQRKFVAADTHQEFKDLYFCRCFYSENNRSFHPLQLDFNNGSFGIERPRYQENSKELVAITRIFTQTSVERRSRCSEII